VDSQASGRCKPAGYLQIPASNPITRDAALTPETAGDVAVAGHGPIGRPPSLTISGSCDSDGSFARVNSFPRVKRAATHQPPIAIGHRFDLCARQRLTAFADCGSGKGPIRPHGLSSPQHRPKPQLRAIAAETGSTTRRFDPRLNARTRQVRSIRYVALPNAWEGVRPGNCCLERFTNPWNLPRSPVNRAHVLGFPCENG
jgi:hypothetical protein